MRLVITSDTHGFHRGWTLYDLLPEGDVFIHAGDYSRDYGSWTDTVRFAQWMSELPYQHKVLCPGNHDVGIAEKQREAVELFSEHGIHLLGVPHSNLVELDGVTFGGGPWMPVSGWTPPWGFETAEDVREEIWEQVPHVNVLVTHTPPMGILDQTSQGKHLGCPVLRKHLFGRIRPHLHIFGHVHEQRGTRVEAGTVFMNACCNTRGTYVRDTVNKITHMTMGIRDPIVYNVPSKES